MGKNSLAHTKWNCKCQVVFIQKFLILVFNIKYYGLGGNELALNNLAEVVTKDLIDAKQPYGLKENKKIANEGAQVPRNARIYAEKRIGKPVVTSKNAKEINLIENKQLSKSVKKRIYYYILLF